VKCGRQDQHEAGNAREDEHVDTIDGKEVRLVVDSSGQIKEQK
jgi:hypothetical protein